MSKFPVGRVVFFATGNIHKFNEARFVLSKFKITVAMLKIKAVEIQDSNIENIAIASTTIGVIAFITTVIGFLLGRKIGSLIGKRAETVGGIILAGIGLRILLEHIL